MVKRYLDLRSLDDALRLLDMSIDYTNGLVRFDYKPR